MTKHRPWTDEDNKRLKAYVASGASLLRTAAAFNRSMTNVRNQARKLGAPFPSIRDYRKRLPAYREPDVGEPT
jgi:hypothetical protein